MLIYIAKFLKMNAFGEIYSADWPEGQEWIKDLNVKVALESLDNSSDIGTYFLNEVCN
jgi:hypothetical protein